MRGIRLLVVGIAAVALAAVWTAPHTARAQMAPPATAGDLRVQMVGVLTAHGDVAGVTLQKRWDGDPDFPAAKAALDMNTTMIANMVRMIYGDAAASRFTVIWDSHNNAYVTYTDGLKANDNGLKTQGRATLQQYVSDISALLASANPFLSQRELESEYQVHVDQTVELIESYAAADYTHTYMVAAMAHEHLAMLASMLSGAVARQFPARFPGDAFSPANTLRASLASMLVEHASLAIAGMQKAYKGAPDLPAAAAALDMNTLMLAGAVGSVYGADAQAQFLKLWRDHIEFFVNYAVSTAQGDEAGRARAQSDLAGYNEGISTLLSSANPNLPKPAVKAGFELHVAQLSGSFDAFASGDYTRAYMLAAEAQVHMVMTGDLLGTAIAAQFPARFPGATPVRLPNTGDGSLMGHE